MIPITVVIAAVGLLIGWGTATVLRTKRDGILLDAVVTPVVFWVVAWTALAIPWHGSYVEGGWTFNDQFPYPMACAFGAACLCALIHEVVRHRRKATSKVSTAMFMDEMTCHCCEG